MKLFDYLFISNLGKSVINFKNTNHYLFFSSTLHGNWYFLQDLVPDRYSRCERVRLYTSWVLLGRGERGVLPLFSLSTQLQC
jgi:hypothetical protein